MYGLAWPQHEALSAADGKKQKVTMCRQHGIHHEHRSTQTRLTASETEASYQKCGTRRLQG
jgi:hypothetical protein